jgi:hypothetical protein
MPEIEYVFLADAADARPGQKFSVLGGGISRLGGPSLPIRHPHLALVVGLRVAPGELGRDHDVSFQLLRPDGTEVAAAAARIRADGAPGTDDTIMTFSVDLWNLVFDKIGGHSLRVAINGAERKRLPLAVDQVAGEGPVQPPFPAPMGQA